MEDKKRLRINGTFRWTEQQTRDLLTIVFDNVKANPEQFEKPTAQKFYDRITESAPNLRNIKWDTMRTKMRHLKTSFLTALKWKGQTGAGLLESGDVKSVEEYIKKTCPFYDDLHAIFARRVNIQPPAIYQSTEPILSLANNEEEALLEIDCETSSTTLLESPLVSPSVILPPTFSENQVSPPCTLASDTRTLNNTTTPKRNLKRPQSSNSFALLFEIQKKKVELETQKLELEKEKEENQFKLQKLQLEKEERIEMEKLRLEHERLKSANN
ncbi:uncharacterized protein LOC118742003 [Rhagoletis pomonella]|uniref:uncharacterized protein LOC118742003 n=1 Tax=Rhagoletis pomonella TaxID=28610 RepID=UPI0017827A3A|nr:uncharacterized protein LOC118742003 [Rhagoletis pomonella]